MRTTLILLTLVAYIYTTNAIFNDAQPDEPATQSVSSADSATVEQTLKIKTKNHNLNVNDIDIGRNGKNRVRSYGTGFRMPRNKGRYSSSSGSSKDSSYSKSGSCDSDSSKSPCSYSEASEDAALADPAAAEEASRIPDPSAETQESDSDVPPMPEGPVLPDGRRPHQPDDSLSPIEDSSRSWSGSRRRRRGGRRNRRYRNRSWDSDRTYEDSDDSALADANSGSDDDNDNSEYDSVFSDARSRARRDSDSSQRVRDRFRDHGRDKGRYAAESDEPSECQCQFYPPRRNGTDTCSFPTRDVRRQRRRRGHSTCRAVCSLALTSNYDECSPEDTRVVFCWCDRLRFRARQYEVPDVSMRRRREFFERRYRSCYDQCRDEDSDDASADSNDYYNDDVSRNTGAAAPDFESDDVDASAAAAAASTADAAASSAGQQ